MCLSQCDRRLNKRAQALCVNFLCTIVLWNGSPCSKVWERGIITRRWIHFNNVLGQNKKHRLIHTDSRTSCLCKNIYNYIQFSLSFSIQINVRLQSFALQKILFLKIICVHKLLYACMLVCTSYNRMELFVVPHQQTRKYKADSKKKYYLLLLFCFSLLFLLFVIIVVL